jgi:hypothetical protein
MTKAQLKARIVPRLAAKIRREVTWGDIVSSVAAADPAYKQKIVDAIRVNNFRSAGETLSKIVQGKVNADANSEADAMLVDDVMTLDEIERAFR